MNYNPGYNDGIIHSELNRKNEKGLHPEYPEPLPKYVETCNVYGCYQAPVDYQKTCFRHLPSKEEEEE